MADKLIKLDNLSIGEGHPPFIVAEMSGNHNQSLDRAIAIVDSAAKLGAHAIKIQTYTADTMTLNIEDGEFFISDQKSLWSGKSLYKLYEEAHTPWDWHKPIFDQCKKHGIIGFSSPFDETAVDFLEELNVPVYKIASFENTDIPLIRKVAATGKPVIISTGMATAAELGETVNVVREVGCQNLVLLKCTSAYPASPENANILTIPHMRDLFQCQVGLSDHTHGIGVPIASVALGATIIEKHFTLSRDSGGVDAAFSMEPNDLSALVTETKRAWKALGKVKYGVTDEEKNNFVYRRSLYIVKDMKKGDVLTQENLRAIRPGLGLPPKHLQTLLGKSVSQDVKMGTQMTWALIS